MMKVEETSAPANPETHENLPGHSTAPSATAPSVRVWLVDDNDRLRMLVADLLGQHEGINCARHFSSPDALLSELASKPGPDVILLDIQMGDRNGLDAVRPIKSLTRSTRVLMFTTCFNPEWRRRALEDGASDYLLKSDTLEKVAARIRSPAQDAEASLYRRSRAKCSADRAEQKRRSMITSSRLLSRTLTALRGFLLN